MQAFILAAGKGTRLLPYTNLIPKPLFPILGVPILEIILKRCLKQGIKKIGINLYYLKEKLHNFLKDFQKAHPSLEIKIFEEKELLGTGGGLFNAAEFFKESTIVINSDILTDIDFNWLVDSHLKNETPISMVIISSPGGVIIDEKGYIKDFRTKNNTGHTFFYTGIQVISPEVFSHFFWEKDLIKIYKSLLKKGLKIGTIRADKFYFRDIGTISGYLKAHEDLLLKKVCLQELPSPSSPFISFSSLEEIILKEWAFIGKEVKAEKGTIIEKCVVWDKTFIPKGIYKNSILTPSIIQ